MLSWLDGTIKVLDFGIAAPLVPGATLITRLGYGVGTFCYMAPEQAVTGKADARSDLYSLGCVLHELVSGRRVFESALPQAEMARHYSEAPPRLGSLRQDVPPDLEQLVLSLLAKNPADRPPSAEVVYERLLPHVVAPPPLPGATAAAPSPNPGRMYAIVAERIAESALGGVRIPSTSPAPAPRLSRDALIKARARAEDLAIDGRLTQAIEVLEEAVTACASLPAERELLFALRMDLANARFGARDYAAALSEFEDVIPKLAAMLGADHRAVLDCRYNEALSAAALGLDETALDQMTVLLTDVETALTASDPLALLIRREIAALLVKLDDPRQAWIDLRALVPRMEAILGVDDPETRQARTLLENLERLDDHRQHPTI
ncbi:protein kinase [Sphaerisporangium sp. NPDC051011]|uniref:serine/threonine protein kinase n=1 Tax=Sphaerisporangium sp. NPDC051011 TaxID=3155792 RepID=UPI0033D17531